MGGAGGGGEGRGGGGGGLSGQQCLKKCGHIFFTCSLGDAMVCATESTASFSWSAETADILTNEEGWEGDSR